MKKDYTHVTFVLDRSGSMASVWKDVEGGYSEIIKQQQEEKGECTFTLVTFDGQYETPVDMQFIDKVSPKLDVGPRGSTALMDALGKSITELGEQLRNLDESQRPEKVLFIVQTDGGENSSREWTKESVKDLIKQQENDYSWQFLFLGANPEAMANAQNLGLNVNNVSSYASADSMASMVNAKFSQTRSMSLEDYKKGAIAFSEEEREALKK